MPLLPLRTLPLVSPPHSAFVMRVDLRAASASVYLRREADKTTWVCNIQSVEEILSATRPPPSHRLSFTTLLLCLYHGVAYEAATSPSPLELHRREVSFAPAVDGKTSSQLTVRVAVQAACLGTSEHASSTVATAVAVDELTQEDVVLSLLFTASRINIESSARDATLVDTKKAFHVRSAGVAFANSYVNWANERLLQFDTDSGALYMHENTWHVKVVEDGLRIRRVALVEVTLNLLHVKPTQNAPTPVLFVLSVAGRMVAPDQTATFTDRNTELQHSISQYRVQLLPEGCLLQVVVLPGSAFVLEGSSLTIRECT
jgi:hypothetical protein